MQHVVVVVDGPQQQQQRRRQLVHVVPRQLLRLWLLPLVLVVDVVGVGRVRGRVDVVVRVRDSYYLGFDVGVYT